MKESRLSIRVSSEELDGIKKSAQDAGMTLADYCLSAIRDKQGFKPDAYDNISLHQRIKVLEEKFETLSKQFD